MNSTWQARLTAWVLRTGMRRAITTLTGGVWVMTMWVAHSLILLTGLGNHLLATIACTLCVLITTPTLSYICLSLLIDLDRAKRHLQRYAAMDDLTGIYNRRHVLNSLEREWSRAQRYNFGCSVVLIDVDRFKSINDSFGHVCGDVFLQQMANEIEGTLRQSDVLGRFGGEEFIVFLPHTDALGAVDAAERVRKRIEGLDFCWNGHAVNLSVSLGVAAKRADHPSLAHLIQEADRALQAAKEAGRNCVRCCNGPEPDLARLYRV